MTDFSGEFSYWNFSMRIKNLIESQVQEPESRRVCFHYQLAILLIHTSITDDT
jgi:hypothetical protein